MVLQKSLPATFSRDNIALADAAAMLLTGLCTSLSVSDLLSFRFLDWPLPVWPDMAFLALCPLALKEKFRCWLVILALWDPFAGSSSSDDKFSKLGTGPGTLMDLWEKEKKNPSKYNATQSFYWDQIINVNINLELLLQDRKEKKIRQNTMLPNLFIDNKCQLLNTSRQNVKIWRKVGNEN